MSDRFPEFPNDLRDQFLPEGLLGQGGSGTVYLVRERATSVQRALKVLPYERAGGEMQRFAHEAKILEALDHPHIARVFGSGPYSAGYWLKLEYLQGRSLRDYLESETAAFPLPRIVSLLRQASEALDYAHRLRVIHRDVKPENLFVEAEDRLKLLDFGMAKADLGFGPAVQTKTGMLLGTPSYMAPERVQGLPAVPQTDVYGLATVAYELFSGSPPFRGDPMQVLQAQLHETPAPLPPQVTPAIQAVLRKALSKKATDRPSSPAKFFKEFLQATKSPRTASSEKTVLSVSASSALPKSRPPASPAVFARESPKEGLFTRNLRILGCVGLGCMLWGLGVLIRSPTEIPTLFDFNRGPSGIEFRWQSRTPVAPQFVIQKATAPVPSARSSHAYDSASREGQVSKSGLEPSQAYSVWIGFSGEAFRQCYSFTTQESFRIEKIEIFDDPEPRLEITGTSPWKGSLGRVQSEEPFAVTGTLSWKNSLQKLPTLWIQTPGSSESTLAEDFALQLLRAVHTQVRKLQPRPATEQILHCLPRGFFEDERPGTPSIFKCGRSALESAVGGKAILKLRRFLPYLLSDSRLDFQERLQLAWDLAALGLIDGTIQAMGGTQAVFGPLGGLSQSAQSFFPEITGSAHYDTSTPPPKDRYSVTWLQLDQNNLVPQGISKSALAYSAELSRRVFHELPPLDAFESVITLDTLGDASSVGLVMRASHPENVTFIEVNGQARIPVFWNASHKAKRVHDPTFLMNSRSPSQFVAPVNTRIFRLPAGVLRRGTNSLKVWCATSRPKPDIWLPTLIGVFLSGNS